jgi:hypothetical protein
VNDANLPISGAAGRQLDRSCGARGDALHGDDNRRRGRCQVCGKLHDSTPIQAGEQSADIIRECREAQRFALNEIAGSEDDPLSPQVIALRV